MEKTLSLARQLSLDFITFVNQSMTPFHVVSTCRSRLQSNGFKELQEASNWTLERGGRYFVTRNNSTILAFTIGSEYDSNNTGYKVIAAHTDSPCLRLAPLSKASSQDFNQMCVTTYGGGLWHTWFDRELSIAGKVVYNEEGKGLKTKLFNVNRPLVKIPNLAIHLTPMENRGKFEFNKESHLRPILSSCIYEKLLKNEEKNEDKKHSSGLLKLIAKEAEVDIKSIVDIDVYLYDSESSKLFGLNEEFISSARIDNLFSSFACLNAIIDSAENNSKSTFINMITLFDHEECGSQSYQGAESLFFLETLKRIHNVMGVKSDSIKIDSFEKALANSLLISADMAHSIHPNYSEKHQQNHQVKLNAGIALKVNNDQRYATDAVSASIIRLIAEKSDVPIQDFIVRNDSPCGSTIGPIVAAKAGIKTLDLGAPQLSMHSIRETTGVLDALYYDQLFKGFFKLFETIGQELLGKL